MTHRYIFTGPVPIRRKYGSLRINLIPGEVCDLPTPVDASDLKPVEEGAEIGFTGVGLSDGVPVDDGATGGLETHEEEE